MKYDLEDRLTLFSGNVLDLCRKLPKDVVNNPLISQIVRSATSIGANYCEANAGASKKDFKNKIFICKKEAQETNYWFKLLEKSNPNNSQEIRSLKDENSQFILIFGKIISTLNSKTPNF